MLRKPTLANVNLKPFLIIFIFILFYFILHYSYSGH